MNRHDTLHATTPRSSNGPGEQAGRLGRPLETALLMVVLVGGFYLLREHWHHVVGNWIYLLLLACPLMHLFHGHGGHGGHGGQGGQDSEPRNDKG